MGPTLPAAAGTPDLAYAITGANMEEMYVNDGVEPNWNTNGFRFSVALDTRNDCQASTDLYTIQTDGTTHVVNTGSKTFTGILLTNGTPCSGATREPSQSGPPASAPLFLINGIGYRIASVQDANNLTLTTAAPANASQTAILQEVNYQYPGDHLNVMEYYRILNLALGGNSWSNKLAMTMQMSMDVSGRGLRDWMGHYENAAIYAALNPGKTLQTLTISTFSDHGDGTYTLGWTTPTSADYLRVKYAPTSITDWIGFSSDTNSFIGSPSQTNWFAATNASGIPAPVTGTQSMTLATGVAGMALNQFSVKALFPAGCNISPATLGPWTNTQVISQTLTAINCGGGTLTWTSSGLPSGVSGYNPKIRRIPVSFWHLPTAAPYAPLISVSDGGGNSATINPSILVNAVPNVTTSSLPAGTQGSAYSVQSIATGGGSSPVTCVANSGVPTGMTVHSGCTIDGTPSVSGTFTVNVKATDANFISSLAYNISITINPNGALDGGASLSGNVKVKWNDSREMMVWDLLFITACLAPSNSAVPLRARADALE